MGLSLPRALPADRPSTVEVGLDEPHSPHVLERRHHQGTAPAEQAADEASRVVAVDPQHDALFLAGATCVALFGL